jgi:ABC-type dipeptide/oligopeptide/nickel transport system ATPase component
VSRPILEVSELTVEFDGPQGRHRALDGVSFTMAEGEALGVVGESGAGKSVLVRTLLRLLPEGAHVAGGEILLHGRDLLRMPEHELRALRGKELSHILPDAKSQLNPLVRIGQMMAAVLRVHEKAGKQEARRRAVEALTTVGITDPARRLDAFPHELSGGMAQRVCVALALLHDPALVVADEPTAGLDVTVQRQVLDLMTALGRERQAAQLFVTRDLGIVAHYCRAAVVLEAGKVVEAARTEDLFASPKHDYTRRLLAAVGAGPAVEHANGTAS